MKHISFILLFFLSTTSFAQSNKILKLTLRDSVFKVILNGAGVELTKNISVLRTSSKWSIGTFYFQPKLEGQHKEGINLLVYNNSDVNKVISESQWSIMSQRALAQKQTNYRKNVAEFPIAKDIEYSGDIIYFQTTRPVVVDNISIVDVLYFVPGKQDSVPEQSYRGQAFVLLERNSNYVWEIRKIINRVLW